MLELGLACTPQNERREPGGQNSFEDNKDFRVGGVALVQKLIFILSFLPRRKYPAIFTRLTSLHEDSGKVWYGLHQ